MGVITVGGIISDGITSRARLVRVTVSGITYTSLLVSGVRYDTRWGLGGTCS